MFDFWGGWKKLFFMRRIFLLPILLPMGVFCNAQEVAPEDAGIAPVSEEAQAASEGLEMEEGIAQPFEPTGPSEAAQVYADKAAEEREQIAQEQADTQNMEAQAELNESLQPDPATEWEGGEGGVVIPLPAE